MTEPIHAEEGWFVLHLFYAIDRVAWDGCEANARESSLREFKRVVSEFGGSENCQIHVYSVWGHKADMGLILVDPDLDHLNRVENELLRSFPPGVLSVAHSYTSMSEISEYMSQEKDYAKTLSQKEGLEPGMPAFEEKMEAFRQRMRHYIDERLYPQLPEHRVMCFYPMNKKRGEVNNWYHLDFDSRKRLLAGHMLTGRKYAGKVQQLVTGSVGLDLWEWGVTLFSMDPFQFKKIVYEMRFDEVSALYGEFGDFIVGIRKEPDELFERIGLAASQAVLS